MFNINLGEIYKHKQNNSIIQIDSFATHMNKFAEGTIVVFRNIEKHNEFEVGSYPSFKGYGTQNEIEHEYELLVSQEELNNYFDWNKIFDLIEKSKSTSESKNNLNDNDCIWIAYSKKGEKIETGFWDWTCMLKIIADYQDDLKISEEEARLKFWEDVKNHNKKEFELCLDGGTLEEALGCGALDDVRCDYLRMLDIECIQYNSSIA